MTGEAQPRPPDLAADELIGFLKRLRAVRTFLDQPVPRPIINAILDVARWSGSASNRQPWELLVVEDRDVLRQLAALEGHAQHLAGAPAGVVLIMTGDPHRVEQETFDEGRLSERVMLAAEAYGVGSCIAWLAGDGRSRAKSLLGIPEDRLVRTVISLGYPDEAARRARPKPQPARKPRSRIAFFGRYPRSRAER